ncbi:hypothetical protein [Deinococcus hopiensis]|uniref:hypothetical protein n=1 Tax=Deinococcus hopiensis TaxID=309885 RepID=UPI001BB06B5C|nr:hypothetical protein [Deinococcus hopiensis]
MEEPATVVLRHMTQLVNSPVHGRVRGTQSGAGGLMKVKRPVLPATSGGVPVAHLGG